MLKFIKSLFISPPPPSPEVARRQHLHQAALDLLSTESILSTAQAKRDAAAAHLKYLQSFNYQALSREIDGEVSAENVAFTDRATDRVAVRSVNN